MSERTKEQLSALVDDELTVSETTNLAAELAADDEGRDTLARYQLISAGFRGEWAEPQTLSVAETVRQRLVDEPAILAPQRRPAMRAWKRGAAGVAIAASVAALAVVYVQKDPLSGMPDTQVAQSPESAPIPVMTVVSRESVQPLTRQENRNRLGRYLMDHNEFATRGGASGFMPYTTFVTYNGR